jgi:hypothetical protein
VLDLVRGAVRVEKEGDLGRHSQVAVVAQFSRTPRMTRSLLTYTRQLAELGYRCVIVSACESEGPLRWPGELPASTVVLRKPNLGYDFGSWAVALDRYPDIASAERVILTNDSLVGPFAEVAPLFELFHETTADVWGATDSWQAGHHLQSYLLGIRGGGLAERPLTEFFRDVRVEASKVDVVRRYEIGLSHLLVSEGYSLTAAVRAHSLRVGADNPTLAGWRELLDRGFPFVKRMIIDDPSVAPGADRLADVVLLKFGAKIADWL